MKTKILVAAMSALAVVGITSAANPYLPLWEHIPDGEPYVFEDPDNPGKHRVYIYGSHDSSRTSYCGRELVVWSASPDSLDRWRYDGVIFDSRTDSQGRLLNEDGSGDVLFAPDVAVRVSADGCKEYFLYPNNQAWGRTSMVAHSSRPDGPFEVINWSEENPSRTIGIIGFDPAVFVDDDGRVYGYWGFKRSYAAELDSSTMATLRPGTEIVTDLVSPADGDGDGRFFEASSIRRIADKYVFVYSRITRDGEYGLPSSNYTLAYAYSDYPLGPYTYGGTIIDARGRDKDTDGKVMVTATPNGNTHGGLARIGDRWWVFYHRQSGIDEYARQAMVSPVEIAVESGKGGRVVITEAEYTSEGFEFEGLDPLRRYPAAIASHFTGPEPAIQKYPRVNYTGPYIRPAYIDDHAVADPYGEDININEVVNLTDGSILGYKYFNFSRLNGAGKVTLELDLIPGRVSGAIDVYVTAPWRDGAQPAGRIEITPTGSDKAVRMSAVLNGISDLDGKHPLYLVISTPAKGESLCTLTHISFGCDDSLSNTGAVK